MDKEWRARECMQQYRSLEAESKAMRRRRPWLQGIGFVSFLGTARVVHGGRVLYEFRHAYGTFGVQAAVLAFVVCVAWGLRDYFREKKVRDTSSRLYKELGGLGYEYDYRAVEWRPAPAEAG